MSCLPTLCLYIKEGVICFSSPTFPVTSKFKLYTFLYRMQPLLLNVWSAFLFYRGKLPLQYTQISHVWELNFHSSCSCCVPTEMRRWFSRNLPKTTCWWEGVTHICGLLIACRKAIRHKMVWRECKGKQSCETDRQDGCLLCDYSFHGYKHAQFVSKMRDFCQAVVFAWQWSSSNIFLSCAWK